VGHSASSIRSNRTEPYRWHLFALFQITFFYEACYTLPLEDRCLMRYHSYLESHKKIDRDLAKPASRHLSRRTPLTPKAEHSEGSSIFRLGLKGWFFLNASFSAVCALPAKKLRTGQRTADPMMG
jgi:hypothetical protein